MNKRNENTTTIFVYGTLKRGRNLHKGYGFDKSEFIGEDSVKGALYSLGWYPILYEKDDKIQDVPGEVFKIRNDIFKVVKNMEESAGYITKKVETKKGRKVNVFFFTNEEYKIAKNRIDEF